MPLAPGTRVGPYEILSPLGAGGMGEVYRARDPRLSRDVAIKVLPADLAQDKDRLKRFEHEVRAAGALNHPNLLTVFDVGQHEGNPYLVSELLEGETLRQTLAKGPLSWRKTLDQAVQIARGLGSAHEKGIVHRDLKPENLFLDREGRAKILDFGLAKLERPRTPLLSSAPTATSPTSPGTVLGTVGYMAPEQVRGEEAGARADIFSFGAVLFEMLSGSRAFQGATAVETMNAILKEDPPEISDPSRPLPPALDRIVRRCLEKTPRARFQSAQDLAFALETLSGDSAGSKPGGLGMPAAVTRKSKAWIALATASALALPIGGFLMGRRSAERPPPSFERLTFRQGRVGEARFGTDGQTVYYSAEWDTKPSRLFSARVGSLESRPLDLPDAGLLGVSSAGEMALALRPAYRAPLDAAQGTLARVPVAGGSPREVLERVRGADWSPDGTELAVVKAGEEDRLEFPIGSPVLKSEFLSHPRVSPRGDTVAVLDHTNWPTCAVVVVDRKGGKHAVTGHEYRHCTGLAWSRDGREIWFTGFDSGGAASLRAVTLDGQERVVHANPGALSLRDISRDGHVLLTRRTVFTSIRGHVPGEEGERDLSWLNDSYVKDLSSDGTILLLGDFLGAPRLRPIFLRQTDGSPAVRLGDGEGGRLSPDGKWVAILSKDPPQIVLLPTGAGQPRELPRGSFTVHTAEWFPDGLRVLAHGLTNGPQPAAVTWTQDLDGGPPVPILQGYAGTLPSPDGRFVLARKGDEEGPFILCPVAGGPCKPVSGLDTERDDPCRWSTDAKTLLVARHDPLQLTLNRVDLATGHTETLKSIAPSERAGVFAFGRNARITSDGRYYVYNYTRSLSDLYLAKGLR